VSIVLQFLCTTSPSQQAHAGHSSIISSLDGLSFGHSLCFFHVGLFSEEQEAARSYDAALVRLKGMAAATNYSLACFQQQLAEHYQLKMVGVCCRPVYAAYVCD
jgi:hypothetical protein